MKKAYLVDMLITTRVIAENALEAEELALAKLKEHPEDYLIQDNLNTTQYDTECPMDINDMAMDIFGEQAQLVEWLPEKDQKIVQRTWNAEVLTPRSKYGIKDLDKVDPNDELVKCNNCGNIYFNDTGDKREKDHLQLVTVLPYDERVKGCPCCETDAYLADYEIDRIDE